jgi:3-oxoacyl-[acyl-carrier-protein] synthase-1
MPATGYGYVRYGLNKEIAMANAPDYYLNALGLCCALGAGKQEVADALFSDAVTSENLRRFLRRDASFLPEGQSCYLGHAKVPILPECDSRNNALLATAAAQIAPEIDAAIHRYGMDRIAVIVGSSTSGVAEGERALWEYKERGAFPEGYRFGVQEMADPAEFLASRLGLANMATTVSTACSSGAKAFSHGAELIAAGLCDVALVGGSDALCRLTVNGFQALGALSETPCNPFSRNRNGISIGEGAALFLMTQKPSEIRLAAVGESSDGYNMTTPDPAGLGAERAMRDALRKGGIDAASVRYVNLHGTATPLNDAMESLATARLFGTNVPCSSAKALIGHTLGAAGALETALCWLTLSRRHNPKCRLPPHVWDGKRDAAAAFLRFAEIGDTFPDDGGPVYAISSSFAFGGSNAAVLLERSRFI